MRFFATRRTKKTATAVRIEPQNIRNVEDFEAGASSKLVPELDAVDSGGGLGPGGTALTMVTFEVEGFVPVTIIAWSESVGRVEDPPSTPSTIAYQKLHCWAV